VFFPVNLPGENRFEKRVPVKARVFFHQVNPGDRQWIGQTGGMGEQVSDGRTFRCIDVREVMRAGLSNSNIPFSTNCKMLKAVNVLVME
jgi:hypothetical protein